MYIEEQQSELTQTIEILEREVEQLYQSNSQMLPADEEREK